MIKRHVVMVASLSGIFGIMMGVLLASWAWMQSSAQFAIGGAVAKMEGNIVKKVELLEFMRTGRYSEATGQLEAWLDKDLVGAGEFARDGVVLSTPTLQAMEIERLARTMTGYQPANDSVNAAVRETFRMVPAADGAPLPEER